jgi:hypothetical protein
MEMLGLSPEVENAPPKANSETTARAKGGANWFYWIAGLSIINTLAISFGATWSFLAGLGITQVIDVIAGQINIGGDYPAVKVVSLAADFVLTGIFFVCGLWAAKFHGWAFIAGMAIYFFDGVLLVILNEWFPAGFHLFVLIMIARGLIAARQVNASAKVS